MIQYEKPGCSLKPGSCLKIWIRLKNLDQVWKPCLRSENPEYSLKPWILSENLDPVRKFLIKFKATDFSFNVL